MRLPDRARSQVVLIGNSRYRDERYLPELPEVRRSIADLRAVLTDPEYGIVPPQNCTTLVDEPDLHTLGDALLAASQAADDFFLVYFIGHGLVGRNSDLYLGLFNSRWESPSFGSLRYDTLRDTVLDCPAETKTIILDCCFSGRALGNTMASSATVVDQMEVDGTYVLTSASRDKLSLILPNEHHTAFTGRLLRLLNNGIPAAAPTLSIDEVYQQLRRTMRSSGLPEPQRRTTGTAGLLALARNRAYGYEPPTRTADQEGHDRPNLLDRFRRTLSDDANQAPLSLADYHVPHVLQPPPGKSGKARGGEQRAHAETANAAREAADRAVREAQDRTAREARDRRAMAELQRINERNKQMLARQDARAEYRERVKELVRTNGLESSYVCPACHATVKGRNLVRHLDEQHPALSGQDLPTLVPAKPTTPAAPTSPLSTWHTASVSAPGQSGSLFGPTPTEVGKAPFRLGFRRRPLLEFRTPPGRETTTPAVPASDAAPVAPAARVPIAIPPAVARDRDAVKRTAKQDPDAAFACPRCGAVAKGANLVRHIDRQHGW